MGGKFMNGSSYRDPSYGAALCNAAYFFFWCEQNGHSRLPPAAKLAAKPSLPDLSGIKVKKLPLVHIRKTQTALKKISKKYNLTHAKISRLIGHRKFGPIVSVSQISKFLNR